MLIKNISYLTLGLILVIFSSINKLYAANHGISVFGDLKYPKNFQHFDYVNPDAPKGGQIKYGVAGTFNNLNPFILKGISADGINMIFDSLMESAADEISSKYGLIAQSAHLTKDKKAIIFVLRQEARFHDGSKITADDVVFSFNKISQEGHPSYQILYQDVANATKINDYKVKFTFKNPNNRELPGIIASLPILSEKYYSNVDFNKTTLISPLGSGPYQVNNVDKGKSITYERVKDYWGKDLAVNKGRHNFNEIIYDYYLDANILVEAFKSGNFDFRQENISRKWFTAYDIDKVKDGQIIKKEIEHNLPTGMQAFILNLRKEKFQNKALRKALNYAFDFEWAKEKIFYGSYKRTNSFFVNTEFASHDLPQGSELKILTKLKENFPHDVPDELFKEIYQNPRTDASGYSRQNLLKAKEILEQSGYYIKNGKLIDPKTQKTVEIEFLIASKAFLMVIAPMKKNLAKIGIKSKIRLVDENQYKIRINEFDYDIIVSVFGQGLIPGNEQYAYWHSSLKDIQGSRNISGVKNEAVDYLLHKIINAKTKTDLKSYTKALDRILLWNFYVIPQWYNNKYRILYKNKFNTPKINPPYSIAIDSWWSK